MTEKPRNAMQAVLDRAAQAETPSASPALPRASIRKPRTRAAPSPNTASFERPSRQNTRLIGGHFPPEVSRQLRILAAEEDTTVQALLEEAISLLLAKKARGRLTIARSNA
jgi:hypothetical protein